MSKIKMDNEFLPPVLQLKLEGFTCSIREITKQIADKQSASSILARDQGANKILPTKSRVLHGLC